MRKQFFTFFTLFSILFVTAQNKDLDSLTLQLAFQKPDTAKVNTSIRLIDILYNQKDYKRAIMFIDESERLAQDLKYDKGIAQAIYYKAQIFALKDDYYNAIDNYNKSKVIFSRVKDTLGIAKVDSGIGMIEIKRGNYNKGIESALSAVSVYEDNNLFENLSSDYNNLATAYFETDRLEESLEYNFKALEVRERLKDSFSLSATYRNIAILYSLKKDHQNAISYYNKVLLLLAASGNNLELRGEILPKIGQEYLNSKNYLKAAENLVAGARLNRNIQNKEGLLQALNGLAQLNLEKKRFDLVERQLFEATAIAKELNDENELLRNYELNMKLDSAKGNFQNAFFWQREYQNLKDKVFKREYINAGLGETDYNSESVNDKLIEEQKIKDDANIARINKLKLISYILLGAFAIVSTFLLLVYLKRNSNVKYTKDLEEKNKQIQEQNEAILIQSKKLEETNVVKDKLFSIVSHDLKDSVSSIKAFLDLLKEGSLSSKEFNDLIPELSENADNASLLLYNLLNWSKSQMESLEPKPEYFNIQEVFKDKIKIVEQKVEKKKIILMDETIADTIYADRSMVEIIVQNLLTNAVKFCNSGDIISISNQVINGRCQFFIKDTGVGISKENQEKLFKSNSFTTIGTTNEKGTGLGLTICKELIELNHGKIWLESSLNMGSKFYVELPRGKTV
ncbi:MAG: tetratricopeptide repeat-containing sensor histidine kinase [Flavobacteriaceae bacterium]|nr:tetratricopeptide repeat-containing sensor histidine kinase [Flavobacteriaceae bacterium]